MACRPPAERAREQLASDYWPTVEAFGPASPETAEAAARLVANAPSAALFQAALEARDFALAETLFSAWIARDPDWFDPASYAAGVALLQESSPPDAVAAAMNDSRFRRLHLTQRAWLEGRLQVFRGQLNNARLALATLLELAPRDPFTEELSALVGLSSDDPIETWRAEQRLARLAAEQPWIATLANGRIAMSTIERPPSEHRRLRDDLLATHASGVRLRWAFWWHHAATGDEPLATVSAHLRPASRDEVLAFTQRFAERRSIDFARRFLEQHPSIGDSAWEQTRTRLTILSALADQDLDRARQAWALDAHLAPADRALWDAVLSSQTSSPPPLPQIAPADWNPVEAGSLELRLYLDLALPNASRLTEHHVDRLVEVATQLEERRSLSLDAFTRLQGILLRHQRDAAMLALAGRLLERFPGDHALANNALYLHLLRLPDEPPPEAWIDALGALEEVAPAIRSTQSLLLLRRGEAEAARELINQSPLDPSPSTDLVRLAIEAELQNVARVRQLLPRLDPETLILSERQFLDQLRAAYP